MSEESDRKYFTIWLFISERLSTSHTIYLFKIFRLTKNILWLSRVFVEFQEMKYLKSYSIIIISIYFVWRSYTRGKFIGWVPPSM